MDIIFKEEAKKLFIGRTFRVNYDQAEILTTDKWKHQAGGVPRGCFLLAFFAGQIKTKQEVLLLRTLKPTNIPSSNDHVASMIDYYKDSYHYDNPPNSGDSEPNDSNTRIDPYTRFEFSISGLQCRILGSFYRTGEGQIEFGADVENFYAPNNYRVYKAHGQVLEVIVNQRDNQRQESDQADEFTIGKVRYSSTRLMQSELQEDVEVSISSADFLGKRTALFGMTRTGKSNTIKKIIQATSELSNASSKLEKDRYINQTITPEGIPVLPVGQLVFDINGEYANVNQQDEGTAIAEIYKDITIRYSCIEKPGFIPMKINFYKELNAGFYWIKKSMEEDKADYMKTFVSIDFEQKPDKNDFGGQINHSRIVAAYRCCLFRAGFRPPRQSKIRFEGRQEFNQVPGAKTEDGKPKVIDPKRGISFQEAIAWFERYWRAGAPGAREDLQSILIVLTRKLRAGGNANLSGWKKFSNPELKHYHTDNHQSTTYAQQISQHLRRGKIVIVDLSEGDPEHQGNVSVQICSLIFKDSMQGFINKGE